MASYFLAFVSGKGPSAEQVARVEVLVDEGWKLLEQDLNEKGQRKFEEALAIIADSPSAVE